MFPSTLSPVRVCLDLRQDGSVELHSVRTGTKITLDPYELAELTRSLARLRAESRAKVTAPNGVNSTSETGADGREARTEWRGHSAGTELGRH